MFASLVRLLVLLALLAAPRIFACAECGGRGLGVWALRELEPKASQLHPKAPVVAYSLDVAETILAPAGRPVRVLSLNGSVPGPTLRFNVGDVARIQVNNRLASGQTSLHWHGLLVPNLEDGVPYLTTPPIAAGESRTFEFLLRHAGTYWYHSHTGLQEQRGVYGAIVVEPPAGEAPRADLPHVDREKVLVLSDWTDESPGEVMRTLLRGSDWYALRKGTAQSWLGALRSGHLGDFLRREKARIPPMDASDVAYDAFLVNGLARRSLPAQFGETIRLRVINAAASTYFYLGSAAGPMTIVAADGRDVAPIRQHRLLIGMAETYDVLVTLPAEGAWEFRATAQDNSGHASLFLGDGPEKPAPTPAPLEIYDMNAALATVLDQLDDDGSRSDAEALASEGARPLPPYPRLRSTIPTKLAADAPVRTVTLKLTGDMVRYLWSINDRPIDEQSVLPVKRGEILRLVLVNNTMMHHPMHLHGHFFRLVLPDTPDPDHAPLKHTVDVPPMASRTIEFLADADGDWLFHCHLLYHMMSGMARVASYPAGSETSGKSKPAATYRPALGDHAMQHPYAWIDGTVQSHLSSGLGTIQRGRDNLNLAWTAGWGRVDTPEHEIDATYSRYLGPDWTVFAGYRVSNRPNGTDAALAGATHRLPYLVDLTATFQSNGDVRAELAKKFPLTSRLSLRLRADYDTAQSFDWSAEIAYPLTKRLGLAGGYDSDYGLGAGLAFHF